MTDADLIQRLISGDNEGYRKLVDTYQRLVFNACFNLLRHTSDSEDIAQDVFIEVFESIHQFRHESKLSTWLYRVSINKSLNHIRKQKTKSMISSIESFFTGDKPVKLEVEDVSANDTPHSIEYKERSRVLQSAISSLPDNQRIAFSLSKFDEISYQEIAEIMNLSLPAIESLIHRAKINLQKKLVNYYKS